MGKGGGDSRTFPVHVYLMEERERLTQYLDFHVASCRLFLLVLRHARVSASIFCSLQLFNNERAVVVSFLPTING